nr:MAG TPA: hypothetical protein [Crassvirales sp.]
MLYRMRNKKQKQKQRNKNNKIDSSNGANCNMQ